MNIELKEEGKRVYLLGNTFAIKDRLKEAGGHWGDWLDSYCGC